MVMEATTKSSGRTTQKIMKMIQRREVKSPFTKEERQGVFVTREESRERRNKLTKQRRTLRNKQPENKHLLTLITL